MNKYNIIQQGGFRQDNQHLMWMVIFGQRSPAGYPVGCENRDWYRIDEGLSYEDAKSMALNLNEKTAGQA